MRFTKMEGCGNDYIYINCFEEQVKHPERLAVRMSERHFGVGADGIVLILPSEKADFRMRMFNNDGSEAEMCGNAVRCIGKYVYERGLTEKTAVTLETMNGSIKILQLFVENGVVEEVEADMGTPIFAGPQIPTMSQKMEVVEPLEAADRTFLCHCVSVGNPHCVIFLEEDPFVFPVGKYGKILESHPFFPNRVNVEFAQVVDKNHIRMRVWERGTGETLACGTGISATAVAAMRWKDCDATLQVQMPGGTLQIHQREDGHIMMKGPAAFSFDGVWLKGEE